MKTLRKRAATIAALVLMSAATLLPGCTRLVSEGPLLAKLPTSKTNWEGAYAVHREGVPTAVLQVKRESGGAYSFTIHGRRDLTTQRIHTSELQFVGRGLARVSDLDDDRFVVETRCSIASTPDLDDEGHRQLTSIVALANARRSRTKGRDGKFASFLGPYTYVIFRKEAPGQFTALLDFKRRDVERAVNGTGMKIANSKRTNPESASDVVGKDGAVILPGEPLVAGTRGVTTFFDRLAKDMRAGDNGFHVKLIKLSRVELDKFKLGDRFPPESQIAGWCSLGIYFGK